MAQAAVVVAPPSSNDSTTNTMTTTLSDEQGDEFVGRFLEWAVNSPLLEAQHLQRTGGVPRFRFPPEPNGYLHIGHAKSMNLNFGMAKKKGGLCYLRYDDTNPEKESKEYIDCIEETVRWLGWVPDKVTFSSDYFDQLYDFALQLIQNGLAYADHSTPQELKAQREGRLPSPYRDTPVEVNLQKFRDMRAGVYDEGEVILRLKMDYAHNNPNMRDAIAYRIKYHPHPHAGRAWCIYPTYDYTHCIIDSLEDITHSLCTLEFENRRDSYYWLLWALNIYRPNVWEFSRLNVAGSVMSKRKINWLVREKKVRGYDDPRLFTLVGLRRRGYTPAAINAFCAAVGVTRTHNVIDPRLLEHCLQQDLDASAPRAFAVLRPLKVVLTNFAEKINQMSSTISATVEEVREGQKQQQPQLQPTRVSITVQNHPKNPALGTHVKPLTAVVYIESTDFREVDEKGYFGLAPGKEAQLKYGPNIRVTGVQKDPTSGKILALEATADWAKASKPKGCLHWVSEPAPGVPPARAEVRLYENLFTSDAAATSDDFAAFLNENSEVVLNAFVDPHLGGGGPLVVPYAKLQLERLGYFSVDPDSTPARTVLNRAIPLRTDWKGK